MNRIPAATPARLAVLALAVSLAGCSTISDFFGGDKVDYKTQARSKPLDVPPDLTQLSRDNRYTPQGGVVSAAAAASAPAVTPSGAPVAAGTPVAPLQVGDLRIERAGTQRWLVVPGLTPEQLWPQVRAFWVDRGFAIATENAETGIMETDWIENRTKLSQDLLRSTVGRLLGGLIDTGERDRYRTRIERTATGSEVYISHRGLVEVYTDERKENTAWRGRDPDPQLEAESLSRLMVRLGAKEEAAKAAVAQAGATPAAGSPAATPAAAPARARALASGAALEVDEGFDRAWRRVGLALDRGGFTVEDRDRAAGLYFVRYADPKNAGKEEPGFWSRLFGGSDQPRGPQRYRIAVKAQGEKTVVSVQTSAGNADVGEPGTRIVSQLVNELR